MNMTNNDHSATMNRKSLVGSVVNGGGMATK